MKANDNIIIECKPHWIQLIIPLALCLFFIAFAFQQLFSVGFDDFIICIVFDAVCFLISYIIFKSKTLKITDTSIVGRVGIIRTHKLVSPISKVQDVSVCSGILGKILGFSDVRISTAGTGGAEYVFKCVTNGSKLQNEFLAKTHS